MSVFLVYASEWGAAFIARVLSLPREWTRDRVRRAEVGIPKTTRFATKITLVQRVLARAFDAPARWGWSHGFRQWLEKHGRAYAVIVPKTNAITIVAGASGWSSWGRD